MSEKMGYERKEDWHKHRGYIRRGVSKSPPWWFLGAIGALLMAIISPKSMENIGKFEIYCTYPGCKFKKIVDEKEYIEHYEARDYSHPEKG
jgi:hypothetical protein